MIKPKNDKSLNSNKAVMIQNPRTKRIKILKRKNIKHVCHQKRKQMLKIRKNSGNEQDHGQTSKKRRTKTIPANTTEQIKGGKRFK